MSPRFDGALAVVSLLYGVCTVVSIPAITMLDGFKPTRAALTGRMLTYIAFEALYILVWVVLTVVFLWWYAALLGWSRTRDHHPPSTGGAIVCWFVPFVNMVHPWATIRRVAQQSGVRAPIGWWWVFFIGSLGLTGIDPGLADGGPTATFAVGSLLELVALQLCWRVVHAFRLADQAWTPAEQISARDAELEKFLIPENLARVRKICRGNLDRG